MLEFRFKPKGKTLRTYMSDRESRVCFIRGPLGSGKTFASCMRVFSQITSQPPTAEGVRKSRWVAVRNTYPDLTGTTIKDWMELFGDPALGKLNMDFPPTHKMKFDLDDGTRVEAELVFLALDRPDSVRKLRGLQATGFWLNEVKELEEDIVDMCDLRHGRYPNRHECGPYWHGMIGDTNAPDDDHWYYRKAEIEKPEGWRFLTQPGGLLRVKTPAGFVWRENPDAENLENLPEGYYIKGMAGKKEPWIRVNLANEYGHLSSGRAIYEFDWSDNLHVSEYPIGYVKGAGQLYMGVDFGMTPAVIIGQMVGAQLRILDEIIAENMGIESFVRDFVTPYIQQVYKVPLASFICCCDPSGDDPRDTTSSSPIEIMQELGYEAQAASSNKPETRWEAVRFFLNRNAAGQTTFKLSPTCDTLRKGFNGGYQFRRLQVAGQARFSDKADKNSFSHCFVGETKISTPNGDVEIQNIRAGDYVNTPFGPRRVYGVLSQDATELVTVCQNGREVTCTPNHPFFTVDGIVRADAVQYSTIITEADKVEESWVDQQNTQYNNLTESGFTGSLVGTTKATTASTCTVQYGKVLTGSSLKAFTYITETATKQTTASRIWSYCRQRIMHGITVAKEKALNKLENTWRLFDQKQPNGISLKKVAGGIRSMLKELQSLCQMRRTAALFAGPTMSLNAAPRSEDSVVRTAKQRVESDQVSIMKRGAVSSAVINLQPTDTAKLTHVVRNAARLKHHEQRQQSVRVYDLQVEDAGCFYAENFLVHNCHDALQYLCMAAKGDYGFTSTSPSVRIGGQMQHIPNKAGY